MDNAGVMVQSVWDEIPNHYPGVGIDAFVVMPNHIHGIIVVTPSSDVVRAIGAPARATTGLPLRCCRCPMWCTG